MKGIGVSSWTIPFEGEELFRWAKEQGLDTISPGFDYDACRTEDGMRRWCRTWSELSEKYGIALSILGVNILCEVGMNRKEKWEEVKNILRTAAAAASRMGAAAMHLPSFVDGEIRNKEELEQTIVCLQYACELGMQYQVEIGHEAVLSVPEYEYILEKVDSPAFYMLFDNENLSLKEMDPAYIYSRFADKFRHAHLKNSNPANGYPQILSENNCFGGVGRVLEEMQKNGFAGWIVSETDYKKARSKTEGTGMLLSDVRYIKSYLQKE